MTYTGGWRPVCLTACWSGKKEIRIGNFWVPDETPAPEIDQYVEGKLAEFIEIHLPEGTPTPNIVKIDVGYMDFIAGSFRR